MAIVASGLREYEGMIFAAHAPLVFHHDEWIRVSGRDVIKEITEGQGEKSTKLFPSESKGNSYSQRP